MGKRVKNSQYTGKSNKKNLPQITLDSNIISYLYTLSSGNMTVEEHMFIKKALGVDGYRQARQLIVNKFEGVEFKTTQEVIYEITQATMMTGYEEILGFLCGICKVEIPRSSEGKIKYAELVENLMQKYLDEDIYLRDKTGVPQSAISTETKKGKPSYSDAKIVAENSIMNGSPIITANEKHLISMYICRKKYNKLRSQAILDKNKEFLKENKSELPKSVKAHLASPNATTYRPDDLDEFIKF